MIGCDWLTIEDRKSRARTRAVIGHRPRSAGRKAAVNDKTSSALRERERERERDQRDKNTSTSTSTFIEHSSEGKEAWTVGVKIYHWSNGESTYGVIFILINSY